MPDFDKTEILNEIAKVKSWVIAHALLGVAIAFALGYLTAKIL